MCSLERTSADAIRMSGRYSVTISRSPTKYVSLRLEFESEVREYVKQIGFHDRFRECRCEESSGGVVDRGRVRADGDDWSLRGRVDGTLDHSSGFLSVDCTKTRNKRVSLATTNPIFGRQGKLTNCHFEVCR